MLIYHGSHLVDKDEWPQFQEWQKTQHIEHNKARKSKFYNFYWLPQDFDGFDMDEIRRVLELHGRSIERKTADAVRAMMVSFDRGVPYYPDCKKPELVKFATDRRLVAAGVKGITKQTFINMLEEDDKNPSFDKFELLPPEIRSKIYVFHFKSFTYRLYAPAQPPVTLASRLLRQESLPLFYQTCAFGIPYLCGGDTFSIHPIPATGTGTGAGATMTSKTNSAPVPGVCDREHHHINHVRDLNKFVVIRGPVSFALIPKFIVKWHAIVYCKYHKEFSDLALHFPHLCLDMHIFFNKKQNHMDYYVHGHCDQVHGEDCELLEFERRVFFVCSLNIGDKGYLSKSLLLKSLWPHIDARLEIKSLSMSSD